MSTPDDPHPASVGMRALWLLMVVATLALGWILLPFYGPILWACIIAQLFEPLNRRLLRSLHGRATLAALLTLLGAVVMVIVPFTVISALLAREAIGVYERLQSGVWNPALELHRLFDALPAAVTELLTRFDLGNFDDLQRQLIAALSRGSQFFATQALSIGQNTFEFMVQLFVTSYVAFFVIRDGSALLPVVRRALPLSANHTNELVGKFATVIRATVKGSLLVAALQGTLGGLAFWVLGVGAALLWGVLMAFLALVPAVGAALVWAPVALYFFVTGAVWKGVALVVWGVLVIGLVDNLLRPMLVGRDTRMPDVVIMLSTLGGMAVFGLNGFVLGPAIAAMFIAVWHLHALARSPTVA